jgi:hypothetical protein
MKVSYNNYMIESTISATNENTNLPVTNLIHSYLEHAFYATANNTVITITLDNISTIDHIAYGYHNLNAMTVKLYNSVNVLLETVIVTIEENETIFYFANAVEDVKKITLTCTTLAALLYIGSVFVGEYITLPNFQQAPRGAIEIRDSIVTSPGGQTAGNRRRNLNPHVLSFQNITNADRAIFSAYAMYTQRSIPHFIDKYPDDHISEPPFYGILFDSDIPMDKRRISDWQYNTTLVYREAR